jgi:ABC-2 type transport system ATP-binding protein
MQELGENHTVLLSTHILPEVNAICNRVLIISGGRIVLDGRPDELGRTMGETFEVSLEAKGPRDRVVAAASAFGTVKDVTVPEPGAAAARDGAELVRLRVVAPGAADIREAMFYRFAEEGLPLLEMKRESLSLEEIFLKLTTQEPAAADTGSGSDAAALESASDPAESASATAASGSDPASATAAPDSTASGSAAGGDQPPDGEVNPRA